MTTRPDRDPEVFICEPHRPGFCPSCGYFPADHHGRHRDDCTNPHQEGTP